MKKNTLKKELDWVSMLVPLAIVLTVCALFMIFPEGSKLVLSVVRGFLGDDFGLYYALLGVGIVGCTLCKAYSLLCTARRWHRRLYALHSLFQIRQDQAWRL